MPRTGIPVHRRHASECQASAAFTRQSGTGKTVTAATDRCLAGSHSGPAQVLRKECQRLRPRIAVRIGPVTFASPVHEGVSSPRVGVELVHLAMLGKFGVKLAHIRRRRVGILLTKQSK